MMAGTTRAYNSYNYGLLRGRFNATSDSYKLALLTSSYIPFPVGSDRQANFNYTVGNTVYVVAWAMYFTCVQAGTTSSGTPTWTNVHGALVYDGGVIWRCDTVAPPSLHTVWADVSAYEVSDGTYATGGVSLTSPSVSMVDGYACLFAGDANIAVQSITAKYAVVYKDATVDGVVKPLMFYFPLNTDGSTQTITSGYFRLQPGIYGYIKFGA